MAPVLAEVGIGGVIAAVVVGYLLGSLPVALAVGRRHGVELRLLGDRNPGYWNAKEQLGTRAALPVLIGDTAKGMAAGALGVVAAGGSRWGVGYLVVAAAMLGHAFPCFAGFRGGRSLLVFVGGSLVLSPLAAGVAVALTVLVALVRRSFAWGIRVGVFGYPFIQLVFDGPARVAATGALMTIIGLRFLTAAVAGRLDGHRPTRSR